MRLNLLKDAKIVKAFNGAGAGTSTQTSNTIDVSGFDSVLVLADLGAVVDTSALVLALQDGALANGSDAANISGANCSLTGNSSNNVQLALDVQLPQSRYVTATLARGTANATINSITMILYNAKSKPVTQPSTIAGSNEVEAAS